MFLINTTQQYCGAKAPPLCVSLCNLPNKYTLKTLDVCHAFIHC